MTRALRALCAPFACAMRAKKSPQFQLTVGESPHNFLFCSLNAQVYTYTQHVHRARNAHVRRSSWTTQSGYPPAHVLLPLMVMGGDCL